VVEIQYWPVGFSASGFGPDIRHALIRKTDEASRLDWDF
jgi:hypothetical protein